MKYFSWEFQTTKKKQTSQDRKYGFYDRILAERNTETPAREFRLLSWPSLKETVRDANGPATLWTVARSKPRLVRVVRTD